MSQRGRIANEMGPMMNMDFLKNYDFWFGVGVIGNTLCVGMGAVSGNGIGQVDPHFSWIWFVGAGCCNSIVMVVKSLMRKQALIAQGKLENLEKALGE